MGRSVVMDLVSVLICWNASSCRGLHSNSFWESRSESGALRVARCGRNCAWYITIPIKVCNSFLDLVVCQSCIPRIFSGSAWIPWSSITCPNRSSLSAKNLHFDGEALMLWSCNLWQTWRISRIWSSLVFENIVISSRYAHTVFPMSLSRTNSITRIAVDGALVSPCSIILHAKVPKGVLMVLRVSSSGATRIWKYQLDRSMVDRYFALTTVWGS